MNNEQRKRLEKLLNMSIRTVEEDTELSTLEGLKQLDMKREALKGVSRTRNFSLVTSTPTTDLTENTLSFTLVSDDNGGTRYDWMEDQYYTELLDINGATSHRLNTFFKNHMRDVDSAIGKVVNVRIEDNQLVGDITFGSDEDSQRIYTKYVEDILTDVSIGYEICDYTVKQGADNELDLVTVTSFDIFEVSAVGVGFDSGATKREKEQIGDSNMSEQERARFAELVAMSTRTAVEVVELTKLTAQRETDIEKQRQANLDEVVKLKGENDELVRQGEIAGIVRDFGDKGQVALDSFGADAKPTADAVRQKIQADFTKDAVDLNPQSSENTRGAMIDAMVDGIAMRVGAVIAKPSEGADKYKHATLTQIASELLPTSERYLNPVEIAERSLVTGDFPLLLQSVGARVLASEFEAQVGTYKAWMKEVDVPDFRKMTELSKSFGGGRLSRTGENGDLKELGGTEGSEEWSIGTLGNKFVLTREMMINDDLGAFTNLVSVFGEMASFTANGMAYDILQGTILNDDDKTYRDYKLADGVTLYATARKNTTSVALSSEALSAGRLKMSKHFMPDGVTPARIVPKFLIVSPALEVTAKEILGATSKLGIDNITVPNVNQNSYTLIVDPEIKSETAWYLLADRRTFKMGFLQGTNRSPVIKKNDSSVMRVEFEGVFDIGTMAEDYKGLFRGNA